MAKNVLATDCKRLFMMLVLGMICYLRIAWVAAHSDSAFHTNGDWHSLRKGFQLTHHYEHKAVALELSRFSQHYFNRLRSRITAHQAFINSKVNGRSLPAELALVPLIESALDGEAISPAKAVGFWQFMPATARAYGLKVTSTYDGRKDLIGATDAALNLLQALYNETGDWLLAIAAYNVGARRVHKAVANARGDTPDFWKLSLPRETRKFVARLLALSRVISAPEQHGLNLPELCPNHKLQTDIRNQDSCCVDIAREIKKVSRIKALDIQRQAFSPPH